MQMSNEDFPVVKPIDPDGQSQKQHEIAVTKDKLMIIFLNAYKEWEESVMYDRSYFVRESLWQEYVEHRDRYLFFLEAGFPSQPKASD